MNVRRLAAALACAAALAPLAACEQKVPEPKPELGVLPPPPTPVEVTKEDVVVGTGAEAADGDLVRVHYTGRLLTGKQFDSSVGKEPFKFTIGNADVIKGWDQGVPGMKVGGKRKLTIPAKLGYGEAGSPPDIPPNATLVFDIELIGIGEADTKDTGAGDEGKAADKKPADKKPADKKPEPKGD